MTFKFYNEDNGPNSQKAPQINKNVLAIFLNKNVVFGLPHFVIKVAGFLNKLLESYLIYHFPFPL